METMLFYPVTEDLFFDTLGIKAGFLYHEKEFEGQLVAANLLILDIRTLRFYFERENLSKDLIQVGEKKARNAGLLDSFEQVVMAAKTSLADPELKPYLEGGVSKKGSIRFEFDEKKNCGYIRVPDQKQGELVDTMFYGLQFCRELTRSVEKPRVYPTVVLIALWLLKEIVNSKLKPIDLEQGRVFVPNAVLEAHHQEKIRRN